MNASLALKRPLKRRFSLALVVVGLLFAGAAAAKDTRVIPGKYIVELESPPTTVFDGGPVYSLESDGTRRASKPLAPTSARATGRSRFDPDTPAVEAYVAHLDREREKVVERARRKLGRSFEVGSVYRHVLNGFVAHVDKAEAARLAGLPGVARVRPVLAYKLEMDEGPALIGATALHLGLGNLPETGGEDVVVGVIDSGINWDHVYFDDADLPGHSFSNPYGAQLGECSKSTVPCNDKLVGVYDFTDEDTEGKDVNGHGTHVASTAVGVPRSFTLSSTGSYQYDTVGVAPHATVISYKACLEDLTCDGSALVDALEQSIEDGVDVVNYSLGGDPVDPWSNGLGFLNFRAAGISFVTSAGNSGPEAGSVTSPANYPWTFAVGSSTHQRRIGNRVSIAGIDDLFALPGTGPSLNSERTAPVVPVDEVGGDLEGCSAFGTNALVGDIALIERGGCTFETKIDNAGRAGATAAIVFNNVDGPPIVMGGLEGALIPAVMISREDGLDALAAIDGQADPTATLFPGSFAAANEQWQDIISSFSSRGPAEFAPGVLKPNVVAPGDLVLAGWFDGPQNYEFLSGTSMASPHAAGALALLKSLNPDWTPDILESTLETTAESADLEWAGAQATVLDAGNGRLRVDRAAQAGLYLPVTRSEFIAADPADGGDPRSLNLAGMWNAGCAQTCSFTRTVRALGSGSWTVSSTGNVGIDVTPASFSLATGESRELTIEVDASGLAPGDTGQGKVVLSPNSGSFVEQRLTVGVQATVAEPPEDLVINATANRGSENLTFSAGPFPEPVFRTSALTRPQRESTDLEQDPTPGQPYSGSAGRQTYTVDVPNGGLYLHAEVLASSADDIDLYVGYDFDGDGSADAAEERCRSTSPTEIESCAIRLPQSGTWWIMVQNWQSSSQTGTDSVELEFAALSAASDPSFVASGPGAFDGGELTLDIHWDEPRMRQNRRWIGAIGLSSSPDSLEDIGVVPVFITRTGNNAPQATALFDGESYPVVLPPGATHDRLFFDLPHTAERLSVEVEGDEGVEVSINPLDYADIAGFAPGTPPAPSQSIDGGTLGADGLEFLVPPVPTEEPAPGRYYVVLENTGSEEVRVDVTASAEQGDGGRARFGLYSPTDRVINQGFEWNAGGSNGFVVWYSYDEAGVPTFYNAVNDVDDGDALWSADLLRTTSIGNRNNVDTVGEIQLTALGEESMIVAWRLNGAHGSERLGPDAPQTCPEVDGQTVSYTGHWYDPGSAEGGTTMIVTDFTQAQVRYYFDANGVGRWIITAPGEGGDELSEELDVLELRGFCPSCEPTDITIETVGTYTRSFDGENSAQETLEFESLAPLNQNFSDEWSITKLSDRAPCQ